MKGFIMFIIMIICAIKMYVLISETAFITVPLLFISAALAGMVDAKEKNSSGELK